MRQPTAFSDAILRAKSGGGCPVIADIKPVSPRDGDLLGGRKPADLARTLTRAGVCALSVVTETKHFGGSLAMLREVAAATSLPVLRKDFFNSNGQITDSYRAGAAAFLLVMAATPDDRAEQLYRKGRELSMEAVVEIHTREELDRALRLEPTIIGINNRNILELEKDPGDVRVTEALAPLVPASIVTISESSLRTGREVRRAFAAGVDAVLVGTALLRAADVARGLAELAAGALET